MDGEDLIQACTSPDVLPVPSSRSNKSSFGKSVVRSDTDWTEGSEVEDSSISLKPTGELWSLKILLEILFKTVVCNCGHQALGGGAGKVRGEGGANPTATAARGRRTGLSKSLGLGWRERKEGGARLSSFPRTVGTKYLTPRGLKQKCLVSILEPKGQNQGWQGWFFVRAPRERSGLSSCAWLVHDRHPPPVTRLCPNFPFS